MKGQPEQLLRTWRKAASIFPGIFTAIVVVGLLKLGIWEPLEFVASDLLFKIRGSQAWDKRVVVVAIDESSLASPDPASIPYQRYAELLRVLNRVGAGPIVLDMVLTQTSPNEAELAAAIEKHGKVILARAWDYPGIDVLPIESLRQVAFGVGHIYHNSSRDGMVREIEPYRKNVPMLELKALEAYRQISQQKLALPEPDQPLVVNWPGPASDAPTYSFVDVINDRVPPEALKGKIIVVGLTALRFDRLPTPFDRNPPTTSVYLHAAVINNLLRQNFLRAPTEGWLILGLLIAGPLLNYLIMRWSTERQLVSMACLCFGWSFAGILFFNFGYMLPMVAPVVLIVGTTASVALSERLRENSLLQQEVERLWQKHHKDLVIRTGDMSNSLVDPNKGVQWQSVTMLRIAQLAALAEQLGRSQSAQAAISRSLSTGLLAADWDGLIWFCNPVAAEYLRVRVGDRLHTHLVPEWLYQDQWRTSLETLKNHNQVTPQEIQRGDRWFQLRLEPLYYQPHHVKEIEVARAETVWPGQRNDAAQGQNGVKLPGSPGQTSSLEAAGGENKQSEARDALLHAMRLNQTYPPTSSGPNSNGKTQSNGSTQGFQIPDRDGYWVSTLPPNTQLAPSSPSATPLGVASPENNSLPLFTPQTQPVRYRRQSKPEGLLLVLEDITARKQVEENLRQQMKELQQLGQLKDDFLSTVSHELRAPMANMKMAIHMLKLAKTDEQRERYLQILQIECARETDLINDLLDLQRLEAGAKEVNPEEICLQEWLPQLIEPFYERTQVRQQVLEVNLEPELPNLCSDRTSLERIVVELVNNAYKYTPPHGQITVVASSTPPFINFTVSNSGSEIPPHELNKIFDKFYRIPSSDRWQQGGTGLGLALVKKLVEQLGGTIQLTSQLGLTTFTVQIPAL
jgi:signal transduction histidine kinase/CHASE2 domain-containing sensor protein